MKKFALTLAGVVLVFAFTTPLHAQIDGGVDNSGGITGCGDSPENPTAILALAGGAGAFAVQLRSRWKAHRRNKQK